MLRCSWKAGEVVRLRDGDGEFQVNGIWRCAVDILTKQNACYDKPLPYPAIVLNRIVSLVTVYHGYFLFISYKKKTS